MAIYDQIVLNIIMIVMLSYFVIEIKGGRFKQQLTTFSLISALIWAAAPLVGPLLPLQLQILLLCGVVLGRRKTG